MIPTILPPHRTEAYFAFAFLNVCHKYTILVVIDSIYAICKSQSSSTRCVLLLDASPISTSKPSPRNISSFTRSLSRHMPRVFADKVHLLFLLFPANIPCPVWITRWLPPQEVFSCLLQSPPAVSIGKGL